MPAECLCLFQGVLLQSQGKGRFQLALWELPEDTWYSGPAFPMHFSGDLLFYLFWDGSIYLQMYRFDFGLRVGKIDVNSNTFHDFPCSSTLSPCRSIERQLEDDIFLFLG